MSCFIPDGATAKSSWRAHIVSVAAGDELLEVPDLDDLGLVCNLPEFIDTVVDSDCEEELGVEVDDFVNEEDLVMYLELVLNLHILCQVKILDLGVVRERLDAEEEEEHVEVYHPEDFDVRRSVQLSLKLIGVGDSVIVAA